MVINTTYGYPPVLYAGYISDEKEEKKIHLEPSLHIILYYIPTRYEKTCTDYIQTISFVIIDTIWEFLKKNTLLLFRNDLEIQQISHTLRRRI